MICLGTSSATLLNEFLAKCRDASVGLPDLLEFSVQTPFFANDTHFGVFESVGGGAPTKTCGSVEGSVLEAMLAAGASACHMQVGEVVPARDFPVECFKHLAVSDSNMSFEQASLVNPAGTIQRLHDAGPHAVSCWIHSRHTDRMQGRAREECLGCYRRFGGDDGLESTLPAIVDDVSAFLYRVKHLIIIGDEPGAIAQLNTNLGIGGVHTAEEYVEPFCDFVKEAIHCNRSNVYDHLLKAKFRQFVNVDGKAKHFLRHAVDGMVSLKMFRHIIASDICVEFPDTNFFPLLIDTHHRMRHVSGSALSDLDTKAEILLAAGHDPAVHYTEYKNYSAFDSCALWHGAHAAASPGQRVVNRLMDRFFDHVRQRVLDAEFDPNCVFTEDAMLGYLRVHSNPLALVVYMHEQQRARIDYTDASGRNAFYFVLDAACVDYMLRNGVDSMQTMHDGRNAVVYLLQALIADHNCLSYGDLAAHLQTMMRLGVNAHNEAQTMALLAQLLQTHAGTSHKQEAARSRDIAMHRWFEDYYHDKARPVQSSHP